MIRYKIWLTENNEPRIEWRQGMDEREFCFWLKGFFDMSTSLTLTDGQLAQIKTKVTEVLTPTKDSE